MIIKCFKFVFFFNISGHDKFYDPALLMAPYLMNSYAAAAAYAANAANVSTDFYFFNDNLY